MYTNRQGEFGREGGNWGREGRELSEGMEGEGEGEKEREGERAWAPVALLMAMAFTDGKVWVLATLTVEDP